MCLVAAIAGLINSGKRCLFVSSGSVGSGVSAFGLTKYPEDIVTRQACAGVGQARLMETYGALFSNFDITVAQVLLPNGLGHSGEGRLCVQQIGAYP